MISVCFADKCVGNPWPRLETWGTKVELVFLSAQALICIQATKCIIIHNCTYIWNTVMNLAISYEQCVNTSVLLICNRTHTLIVKPVHSNYCSFQKICGKICKLHKFQTHSPKYYSCLLEIITFRVSTDFFFRFGTRCGNSRGLNFMILLMFSLL